MALELLGDNFNDLIDIFSVLVEHKRINCRSKSLVQDVDPVVKGELRGAAL